MWRSICFAAMQESLLCKFPCLLNLPLTYLEWFHFLGSLFALPVWGHFAKQQPHFPFFWEDTTISWSIKYNLFALCKLFLITFYSFGNEEWYLKLTANNLWDNNETPVEVFECTVAVITTEVGKSVQFELCSLAYNSLIQTNFIFKLIVFRKVWGSGKVLGFIKVPRKHWSPGEVLR